MQVTQHERGKCDYAAKKLKAAIASGKQLATQNRVYVKLAERDDHKYHTLDEVSCCHPNYSHIHIYSFQKQLPYQLTVIILLIYASILIEFLLQIM